MSDSNVDSKNIKTWKYHLQDEIDASFLYKHLAAMVDNEKNKKIYLSLAAVEDKHVTVWKDLLEKNNVKLGPDKPSFKAKSLYLLSKRFGYAFLTKLMLKEEATEVKSYMGLYNASPAGPTKNIALKLAKDSAEHANRLMGSGGITEEPWHNSESGGLLRNVVYGFNDGLTANFGLIAGVIGAAASPHIILISGIAGMIADSLSMGASGYLAAVSEKEVYEHEKSMEADEIKLMPELETEELALIYEAKGMEREEAVRRAVEAMKNPEQVLQDKVREELGMTESLSSPLKEGWITGTATAIGAIIPIIPFFFLHGALAVWTSLAVAMLTHFGVGAARSIFTGRSIFRSGFDMFIVGMGVAAIGYFIGELVSKLVQ
jgi:VIT1/CCC1 family predicted Fe2+/Mn2+ transporter/rubrerythrin